MPTYPYISGQGALLQAFSQLRKGFPPKVDAGYLQRFKIAPANESYVISILRHLGLIDGEGNRVEANSDYFYGNDDTFKSGLEGSLRTAYPQLFSEMGDGALEAERDVLTHWFRAADRTSELVGQRQASTFQTLAALAGQRELPTARSNAGRKDAASRPTAKRATTKKVATPKTDTESDEPADALPPLGGSSDGRRVQNAQDVGLTVRIEVNLPPGGDPDTYDAIFASIKKHLMS